jgi:hypothetical protein
LDVNYTKYPLTVKKKYRALCKPIITSTASSIGDIFHSQKNGTEFFTAEFSMSHTRPLEVTIPVEQSGPCGEVHQNACKGT